MKKLLAALPLLFALHVVAAPRVDVESAAPRLLVLTIRNEDKKPYFYFSPFVDEVPYLVRFIASGKQEDIGSTSCGTGADWHRLDPQKSIHIRIAEAAAFEAPDAAIIPLLFSQPDQKSPLVQMAKLTVEDSMKSASKKEANQSSTAQRP